MSEAVIELTPEQEAAVNYRGGTLLVSAAAGSGKTKVLVDRLLSYVAAGANVDEFLVITYTRAAAAELREKIHDAILKQLADDPTNRILNRQALLCRGALIGTIHSFCTEILRENAHNAGLPSDFRVLDENESDIIKAEVIEDVLDASYVTVSESAGFSALLNFMRTDRDDKWLVKVILDIHKRLQSDPSPREWVREMIGKLKMTDVGDVSETAWGSYLIGRVSAEVRYWHSEMIKLKKTGWQISEFNEKYGPNIEAVIVDLEIFLNALDRGWDEAGRCSKIDFSRVKVKRLSGYDNLKNIRNRCKEALKKCSEVFENSSDEHKSDMEATAPAIAALLQLVLDFDKAYSEEKQRRGVADFSDLEHLSLSLLIDPDTGEKTPLALAVSRRFREILVDEYQDVNAVQEHIFNAVSQNGDNIFMVGDVKQSIYRFRLADPSIFMQKYKSFSESSDEGRCGAVINLPHNFRSRAGILDAVNRIFTNIMSVEFGEMDYTEREKLIPGREKEGKQGKQGNGIPDESTCKSPEELDNTVEIKIIDMSAINPHDENEDDMDEDEEEPTAIQTEARYIAGRIRDLINSKCMIPVKNEPDREIIYSDIVILLRTIQGKAFRYAIELNELDIPVSLPGGEGYLEAEEISAVLSLLEIIDNPWQDIPLAATMRNRLFGFTADELAEIRSKSRGTDFYKAVTDAAESSDSASVNPELCRKCKEFLITLEELRIIMPDMPADRFIWHVFNKTGFLGAYSTGRGGRKRRDNLIKLAEFADIYERSGYKGIFGFLTFVRGLRERGADLMQGANAVISGSSAVNAVRIMSIHKSKGLEFPVVFLADTAKKLNFKDLQQPLVLHPELGIGPMRLDKEKGIEYTTLARMAVQKKIKAEISAEELRVLYVAMTRAREKLIITAAFKDAEKEISRLKELVNGAEDKVPPQMMEACRSMAGWVLIGSNEHLLYDIISSSEIDANIGYKTPVKEQNTPPGEDEEALKNELEMKRNSYRFSYPYATAPGLPSKLTVTGLKERVSDPESVKTRWVETTEKEQKNLSAAERGTALHYVMQHADYKMCSADDEVRKELQRLVEQEFITAEQAAVIEVKKIKMFFKSEIGQRLLRAEKVNREFKFSLLSPAGNYFPDGGNDTILLQGVIDCFFEEDGEIVIIDFKTDRVSHDSIDEKARQYEPQLDAYAGALERITGKRIKEKIIYFFTMDMEYKTGSRNGV